MSAAKQEQIYAKQLHHLQDKMRAEESIEQKEKNIKTNRAKCIAVEQDTNAITEYLEFDLPRKQQRLAELQELYKQQTEKSRLELEKIDETNNQKLQKLENELKEVTSNLSKNELKHAEVLNYLQKQIQSRKDRLDENQKNHKAKVTELQHEILDAEVVARILKDTEEEEERIIRDDFTSSVKDESNFHQMWRDKLVFLRDNALRLKDERDGLARQLIQDQKNLMEAEQELHKITPQNKVLQKVQKLRDMRDNRETEVHNLKFSVEHHGRNMKCAQHRLLQRMVMIKSTCQEQKKEIDGLKAVIEAERSRTTELSMAMKEAHIIFKHITEEPKMDLQKLRRLLTILESYAPQQAF